MRVAWWIGVVALGVRGIKKLFGLGKKKKEKKEGEESTEKKGFRQRPFGKFLKWTGIGTWAYYVIHGITTGKRWLKDFFDRKKKWTDNRDESWNQLKSYEEFVENNPKDAEKYEAFGGNVDGLYENIFSKELAAWWQDDGDMNTVAQNVDPQKSLKWLVPFCMDNSFSNVGSMLSERGVGIDLIEKNNEEIKTNIVSIIKKAAGGALSLFLKALPSWAQFAVGKNDEEKAAAWMENSPDERIKEIKLFFREQMRVTTFLKTKEWDLLKAIAAKKYAANPAGFSDVSEAIDGDEWFKNNIENDSDYKSFRWGPILGAYDILKKYWVMNWDLDEDTKKSVQECDDTRDDILFENEGWSILDRCKTDIQDGTLESKNKNQLSESCDKITEDIQDLEEVAADKAMDMYGRLFNTENANRAELLNNSTILPLLRELKEKIPNLKQKIQSGNMNTEDVAWLKLFMNNYFALKKELEIGKNVYQLIKSDDGSIALTYGQLFADSLHNMKKWWEKLWKWDILGAIDRWIPWAIWFGVTMAPIAIVARGVVVFKTKWAGAWLKYIAKVVWAPITLSTKVYQAWLWTARKINGKFVWPAWSLRRRFFDEKDGPKKLLKALEDGKISLSKAREIVDGTQKGVLPHISTRWQDLRANNWVEANRKLLKQAFTGTTMVDADWDILAKHIDNRLFNRIIVTNMTDGMKLIKQYDAKIWSLTSNQKKFFDLLTDSKRLSTADAEALIKNIDHIEVERMTDLELKNIIKEIKKDMSVIYDPAKINKKIADFKKAASATEEVIDVLDDASVKRLNDLIDVDLTNTKAVLREMNSGGPGTSKFRVRYYNDTIESLETLKFNAKKMSKLEFNSIMELSSNGFEVSNIAKLYRMSKAPVDWVDLIGDALRRWDIWDIKVALRTASETDDFTKIITKSDIDEMITSLDGVASRFVKSGDEIATIFKSAVKLFTKLT